MDVVSEHSTQRVADDRRCVDPERVEDVVDQLARVLTDVTASITGGVRQGDEVINFFSSTISDGADVHAIRADQP